MKRLKVLTLCSAGTVRSVGMAHKLKNDYGIDAVPLGHDLNSQETIDKMSDWADVILVMQPKYAAGILKRNAHKVMIADVGPDVWGNPLDRDLQAKVGKIAYDLYQKGTLR
jgi:predicted protein tyrosine phosphatase